MIEDKENNSSLFTQFRLKKENVKVKPTNYAIENKFLQRRGNVNFRVGVSCMQGKRETMEDAHTIVLNMKNHPGWGFFGVFDGHEGADTANFCSRNLWKKIDASPEFSEEIIRKKFLELDDDLGDRTSGSTACVLMVNSTKEEQGHHVIVGNLGDSRSFICSYDSPNFRCLTTDHKPSLPEEEARIAEAGAQVFRNRVNASLAVSRAFGDTPFKDNPDLPKHKQKVISVPDVSHVYLKDDEFLFICCDGIFEAFSNEGTMEYLRSRLKESRDITSILSDLLSAVLKGGSRDNMSAMIVQLCDGTDYNNPEPEFILGTWYSRGNESYMNGYRLDCENHGLKWEDVEKILPKSNEEDDSVRALSVRSLPLIVNDKTTASLKAAARPGISKSSRTLHVSPSTLAKFEDHNEKKEEKREEKREDRKSEGIHLPALEDAKKELHEYNLLNRQATVNSLSSSLNEKQEKTFKLKIGRAKSQKGNTSKERKNSKVKTATVIITKSNRDKKK